VAAAVDSLDAKLMAVLGVPPRSGSGVGIDPADEDFTSLEYLARSLRALAGSIDGAPAAPTQGDRAAMQSYQKILDADLATWNQIRTTDLPRLNSLLKQNGLPALE
jgi:hypothetical protein